MKNKTKEIHNSIMKIGAAMLALAVAAGASTPAITSFTQAQSVTKTKKKAKTTVLKAITLTKGKSKTVSVKTKSKVKWTSSNAKVASVKSISKSKSKVKVTAKKEGSTKVSGKAGSAKWSFTVKVSKKFDFWIEYAPKTVKYYSPGFAANYVSYGSQDDEKDPEGSDVAMITGGTLSDKNKISCVSSDASVLRVAKFTKDDGYKDGSCDKSFKLIPYKTGTVTITMKYPGGSYKKKVIVKPSAVYEKIKNFIPAVKNSGLDDAHKAYLIAAWLYKNTLYGYAKHNSIYGLIVEGKGVCEDYAEAYEWMAKSVGLDCHTVTGSQDNHAWNQVKLDGKWYNVDATGSSPEDKKKNFSDYDFPFSSDACSKDPGRWSLYNGKKLNNHVPATSTKYDEDDNNTQLKYWSSFEQTDQFKQLISL